MTESKRATRIARYHARARERGVNPIVYWVTRAIIQPFFHLYFRLSRIGREHIPETGPVIFAANHRSFLDPFIMGVCSRRPIYYVAKREIFANPLVAWFVGSLGAFPVHRGAGDGDMLETARAILERGDCVLMFPEGTRTRPGALGRPKRGVGRLALETGAPVVPVAMIGTEAVRKGWMIRPHKIRVRIGRALTFPKVESVSPQLAGAVTDRIWPNVMLQWEWLGGLPPLRRAAVVGTGERATSVAAALRRAKIDVSTDSSEHSGRSSRSSRSASMRPTTRVTTSSSSRCPARSCPPPSRCTRCGSRRAPACSSRRTERCRPPTSPSTSRRGR